MFARPAVGEARAFAECVKHPLRNLRPVHTDGVGLPLRALDARTRTCTVDLQVYSALEKVLLAALPITPLEVRSAPFVERYRL